MVVGVKYKKKERAMGQFCHQNPPPDIDSKSGSSPTRDLTKRKGFDRHHNLNPELSQGAFAFLLGSMEGKYSSMDRGLFHGPGILTPDSSQ